MMLQLVYDCVFYGFCLGHFGVINLKYPVINPYFLKEIAALLNKICPGCKYMRKKQSQVFKKKNIITLQTLFTLLSKCANNVFCIVQSSEDRPERCRYCTVRRRIFCATNFSLYVVSSYCFLFFFFESFSQIQVTL